MTPQAGDIRFGTQAPPFPMRARSRDWELPLPQYLRYGGLSLRRANIMSGAHQSCDEFRWCVPSYRDLRHPQPGGGKYLVSHLWPECQAYGPECSTPNLSMLTPGVQCRL